jgi:hypothetical protein
MKTLINYLADGSSVVVPDERVSAKDCLAKCASLLPSRGYAHSLLVMVDGRCIGWIGTDQLGFASVKDWMASGDKSEALLRAANG